MHGGLDRPRGAAHGLGGLIDGHVLEKSQHHRLALSLREQRQQVAERAYFLDSFRAGIGRGSGIG